MNALATSYDVIIVGAGSAGCTLAARLSERSDRRVLLLEAGADHVRPEDFPADVARATATSVWLPGHPSNWSLTARVQPDRDLVPVARGRIVGGSSAINGTVFHRGRPADFDAWAAAGNDLWSYEQVLPFYIASERDLEIAGAIHGDAGPMPVSRPLAEEARAASEAFAEACHDAGFAEEPDKNAPGTGGVGPIPRNIEHGTRVNAAMAYLTPAVRSRPNLTVRGGSSVRRVVFEGTRATGVEIEAAGASATVHADQVVLSAGAIKSPQLLLLSGVGPAVTLDRHDLPVVHDSPGVGTRVRDHVSVYLPVPIDDGAFVPAGSVASHNSLHHTAPGSAFETDLEIAWGKVGSTLNVVTLLNMSRSLGEITLTSADPAAPPAIDYRFLTDESDLPRIAANVRAALALVRSPSFRRLNVTTDGLDVDDRSDAALHRWIRQGLSCALHTHNSTPMGPASDPNAVVDQRGRVHGVEGLRVVDVGIVPAIRNGPAATAIMIGERAAALIDDER